MCCECCSVTQRKVWVFGLGTIFISLGIALIAIWPDLSARLMHENLILKPGSEAFASWAEAPIPIYMELTMFNWTNPEQIRNPLVKPNFVEMGPYVFLEKRLKQNITFHDDGTVTYSQRHTWFFDKQRSNGTLEDKLTAAHVITATVADMMRHKPTIIKDAVDFVLTHKGRLYATKTVGEWIFDGYQDDLIDFLKRLNFPKIDIPYNRFGWMVDRNGSAEYDGSFTVNTGAKDIGQLGVITQWNGKTESGFYDTPCGTINGTVGDIFPPNMDSRSEITIFANDACRYMNLAPNGTSQLYDIEANKWTGTIETLDSGENYPNQKCFCDPAHEECPKTGVVNCKKCRKNAPIYVSFPHFHLADRSYLKAVTGLHPDPEKHTFTLAVEPKTGIPLQVEARLQINLMIEPDDVFKTYRGVPKVLMPMFWLEQKAILDEKTAGRTKLVLHLADYGRYFAIVLIILGLLLIVVGVVLTIINRWECISDDDEDLLVGEKEEDKDEGVDVTN